MRGAHAPPDFLSFVGGRPLVVLEAPSNLGLMPPSPGREPGVRRMPEALRRAGLPTRIRALWGGRVDPPTYLGDVDPATGIRNGPEVAAYAAAMAPAVGAALDLGFPLVLGGDCSILLGCFAGLRRRGRAGLVFFDAHDDFATPETSASRGAAAMELSLATGRGPEILPTIEGHSRLVKDEDVIVVAAREKSPDIPFRSLDVPEIRLMGSPTALRQALAGLRAERFWLHLDVDVLDPDVMPAVDSPEPGGLTTWELSDLLRVLLASGRAIGMDVTILDPDRDPDGGSARRLVSLLADVFAPATGARR